MVDMNVEMTEPTTYEEYEEYVEPVEVKQANDISAEVEDENNVDVFTRLTYDSVKPFLLLLIFNCKSSLTSEPVAQWEFISCL